MKVNLYMSRYGLLIVLMICVFIGANANAENTRLKVGIYNNPPAVFLDEKGTPQGVYVDTLNAIAEKENWTIDYVFGQWEDLLDKVKTGDIDLLTAIAHSPERETWLDFNRESFAERWGVVYAPEGAPVRAMADLAGKRVAFSKQDIHASFFKQAADLRGLELTLLEVAGYEAVFEALKSHKADAGVVSNGYGESNAGRYGLAPSPLTFKSTRLMVAFPKGQHNLIAETLDVYLKQWKNEPGSVYLASYQRWLGPARGQDRLWSLTPEQRGWLAKHNTVRVAFDGHFPPYSYLNAEGQIEGLAVDLLHLMADRLGIRLEIYPTYVWKDLFEAATQVEVDVVATMVHRPEREQWFVFTRPYVHKSLVVMTRVDDNDIQNREDIAGKRIALVRGYQYVPRIIQDFPSLKPTYVNTMLDGLNAVATHNADAAVTFFGAGRHLQMKYGIANLKFAAIYDRNSSLDSIAVRKDWPELAAILDKALVALWDTDLQTLYLKWNTDEVLLSGLQSDRLSARQKAWLVSLAVILGLVLLAFMAVIVWNRTLRSMVGIKTQALEKELAERFKAEEALRESRQVLEEAQAIARLGSWDWDILTNANIWSNEMFRIFGHEPGSVVPNYDLFAAALHPADKDRVLDAVHRSVELDVPYAEEYRIIRPDGSEHIVHATGNVHRDEKGRALKMVGAVLDITDRKQAEEAMRESEEKHRSMVESMKAAVYICSSDFRVEYMNPAMIKRTGRDATGEVCHKAINDLDEQCPFCVHDKIQQGKTVETEIVSPKDKRHYNVSHSPIFHQDGSISKMTIYRDRTESKKAEEERIRLATAIEHAAESVIIADRPGTIQYVNPSFERLSGYTQEELVGQNFRILKSDKHDEKFYQEMWDIISKGNVWAGRITNRMKDGTLREFETRISPVRDSSGEIINFVSVNRNVTQEKALEAQLQHAQRMDAIGTLAGGVAHDFNNILSSVIGFTELALDDAKKGTLQYKNLQEVLVAGSRAKDLVLQILTFSRQSDQEQKPVNVQLIAKEALKLLRASIPSTIEIKQNIQSEALVMGDSTQIHQVLMNLCTNAAHAVNDKGGVLTVDLVDIKLDSEFISGYPDLKPGSYINLTVTDTGHGMVPDVLDKIFDPFFTTKEKGEGTGMGLSVVHGIVHSHGGSIYAYSEPGEGSTFRMFLPVFKRRLESEERIERPIPTGTERLLFIDDEPTIVNMGKQILESLGYDVIARTSSIEALEYFKAQPDKVDLVITDLTMPKMTGEVLANELIRVRPDIPVILCTGFSARVDEKKAMDMGIRALISKPILKREIAETIRVVLDG